MAETEAIKGKIYKCPNCGSDLRFDPQTNRLKCTHCGSLQDKVPVKSAFEIPYTPNSEKGFVPWGNAKTLKCRSCGAEFSLKEYETAAACPFCATSNIMLTDDIPGLKPNAILPFSITQEEAKEYFKAWIKKRVMSPNSLKKLAEERDLKGLYVPMFTFDTNTTSTYSIRYGVHRTVTTGSGDSRKTVTVTDWYTDSGMLAKAFDDVQIEASQFLLQKNVNKMGGFDTDKSVFYDSQFIAGFGAERYSVGLDDSWEKAKMVIDSSIKAKILSRYNYDELDYLNVSTQYNEKTYKYLLAPVWFMVYNYKGQNYTCVINGRTGTADGRAPLSKIKVALVSVAGAAVLGAIFYLIYKFAIE